MKYTYISNKHARVYLFGFICILVFLAYWSAQFFVQHCTIFCAYNKGNLKIFIVEAVCLNFFLLEFSFKGFLSRRDFRFGQNNDEVKGLTEIFTVV